jgi:hypothetical protein
MNKQKQPFLPLGLILLDAVGMVLVGLGVAKSPGGVDIIPEVLRFENYGPTFIVVGVALMIPLVLHILRRARQKREAPRS